MKTFPALIVKSDGLIYAALASAKDSAILVSDQGKAKAIIKEKFGHDLDQMTINTAGYEYPIPDLQWEVVAKPVKEGFEKYNFERVAILKESTPVEPLKVRLIDFLKNQKDLSPEIRDIVSRRFWDMLETESTPSTEQESQEELWWSVLALLDDLTTSEKRTIPELMKQFTITRR